MMTKLTPAKQDQGPVEVGMSRFNTHEAGQIAGFEFTFVAAASPFRRASCSSVPAFVFAFALEMRRLRLDPAS
jgi:hypothetical protein